MKKFLYLGLSSLIINYNLLANDTQDLEPSSTQKPFTVTLQWLKDKPRTFAKDFYILQYLKQDITSNQAKEALGMANYVNNNMFYAYAKKFNHDETTAVMQCMKAKANELIYTNADCIKVGLTLHRATKLSPAEINTAISKVEKEYPAYANNLKVLAAPLPFTKLISSSKDDFYKVFFGSGVNFRTKYFNYKLPKRTFQKIKDDKRFNKFIKYTITNTKLTQLHKNLLHVDDEELSANSSFFLALNAVRYNNLNLAYTYLNNAYKKSYYAFDKDKVVFWQYLTTLDENYLIKLSNSNNLNIYSLYAKELLNKPIENIVYDVSLQQNEIVKSKFDVKNQFEWIKVIRDTRKISLEKLNSYKSIFNTKETKPHLAYLLNKFNKYQIHYFLTPYKDYLKDLDLNRQILIYSIGRQESNFIPSSISTATAQGVMQIMPFLSKAISKKIDAPYNIYKMFDAKTNLTYANYHLNFLNSQLQHPLFIAYSYNGGYGYYKYLRKNNLFKEKNRFEPFMSMELVSYDETRRYGKKVLANYYIYKNFLDKENSIKLSSIFQNLLQ